MIIAEPRAIIAEWVGEKTNTKFAPPYAALAATENGRIVGALVFHNWQPGRDIEISVAAERLPRALLAAAFNYVTRICQTPRATFRTRADNAPAIKAMERLNAFCEGRQRRWYGDCDALLFGLMQEDFPYGRKFGSVAAAPA